MVSDGVLVLVSDGVPVLVPVLDDVPVRVLVLDGVPVPVQVHYVEWVYESVHESDKAREPVLCRAHVPGMVQDMVEVLLFLFPQLSARVSVIHSEIKP